MALEIIFQVCGGLGVFLLGMKNMSEGMQAVAGERLRKMIGAITNNRLMASSVGTLVTCVIQSSSVTTVMVVGMVNSGDLLALLLIHQDLSTLATMRIAVSRSLQTTEPT